MASAVLFVLKWFLIILDFTFMLLTFGWIGAVKKFFEKEKIRTVPVGDDPSHRVDPMFKGKLNERPTPGVDTLYDLQQHAFSSFSEKNCMGVREFLGQHSAKVKKFGPTQWLTFKQVEENANKFGAALAANGLVAAPEVGTLDKLKTPCSLAIFENTCPEWMQAAFGAFSQSVIVTTIYATLGIDSVVEAINDGVITAVVCNKLNIQNLLDRKSKMPTLKVIIYTDYLLPPDDTTVVPSPPKGVKIFSFSDFIASGDVTAYPPKPPKATTIAVNMYTSGSTGKPKGVVILHKHVVACAAAGRHVLEVDETDCYLGYLPLAHILELMAEFLFLGSGCSIAYADPKTLTTTGAYPIGALEQYSPTMMAGVPKVWDVIKKGVQAKLAAASPALQYIVEGALQARNFAMKHGYDTPLFKILFFKKFKAVVGGKLSRALSGGGPLNADAQEFCRAAFGCPIIQGYGLTETCAGLTIQPLDDFRTRVAGMPISCCEVKLESTPEIMDKAGFPYLNTDRKDVEGNSVWGRGEILVKGNNVSLGYYMMPDKTKESYDENGFFHTGDIGQFESDGSIKIVDRMKNLVKLRGGEYVALENMEMSYGNSSFVDPAAGGICCFADGDMDRPVAFMHLSEPYALRWAKQNGFEGDFEAIKKSEKLMKAVLADMKAQAKATGLTAIEVLNGVAFMPEPWTPENGCLTAANKLQRRVILSSYEKEFGDLKKKGIF